MCDSQFECREIKVEAPEDLCNTDGQKQSLDPHGEKTVKISDIGLQSAIMQINTENKDVLEKKDEKQTTSCHGNYDSAENTDNNNEAMVLKAENEEKVLGTSRYNLRKRHKKTCYWYNDNLYMKSPAQVVMENLENGTVHLLEEDQKMNIVMKGCNDRANKTPRKSKNETVRKHKKKANMKQVKSDVSKLAFANPCKDKNSYNCMYCEKYFSSSDLLQSHIKVHMAKKTCKYKSCGEKFVHKTSLSRHIRRAYVTKPFVCNICFNEYNTEQSLRTHNERMHSRNSQHVHQGHYICTICSRVFKQFSQLTRHEVLHTGKKPYLCSTCGKQFNDVSTLNTHVRLHTGDKPYVCNICGKGFSDRSMFHRHKLVHSGERPYLCTTCGKSFRLSTSLKRHERTHTGYKPYPCEICGTKLADLGTLKKHILGHKGKAYINGLSNSNLIGVNVFKCGTCEKVFNDRSTLRVHKRLHTGEKPYECSTCGKRFTVSGNLHKHQRIHV